MKTSISRKPTCGILHTREKITTLINDTGIWETGSFHRSYRTFSILFFCKNFSQVVSEGSLCDNGCLIHFWNKVVFNKEFCLILAYDWVVIFHQWRSASKWHQESIECHSLRTLHIFARKTERKYNCLNSWI